MKPQVEIEMPVAELKMALPGYSKIILKKPSLPVLGCLKIRLDENKRITLTGTNLDETAYFALPTRRDGLSGEVLVSFQELTKIVRGCNNEDSVRIVADNESTIIRYSIGGSWVDHPVEHLALKEWPVCPILKTEDIALPETFKQTLKQALECSSVDSTRYVLQGACLERSDSGHYVVATDGRHLFAANSFTLNVNEPVLIQARKFVTWPEFMQDGPWRLKVLNRTADASPWIQISSDHWAYVAKQIDGNYPNWRQTIPQPNSKWTRIELDDVSAEMLIGSIPMMPGHDREHEPVELDVREGTLFLTGTGKNGNLGQVRINAPKVTGKDAIVSLNRYYLLRALRFGFRTIEIDDSLTPVLFTNVGKTMVVMPVRMAAAPTETKPEDATPAPTETNSPRESTPAAEPSSSGVEIKTTDRVMPDTLTPPQRGNITGQKDANKSAIKELLERIESIKTALRDILGDLNDTVPLLKQALKEQKATEKEIETVRSRLREIKSVEI